MSLLMRITLPDVTGIIEILVLTVVFYGILIFFRGTRSAQVMTGLILFLLTFTLLTHFFHLDALNWLLQRLSVYVAVAFVIVFQPEIRRALAELGKQHMFTSRAKDRIQVDHVISAVNLLAERKIGALIAIEREIGTRMIRETGIAIEGLASPGLIASLFFPQTPLHDGGVIIKNDRILAAGCIFPLSQREEPHKSLGTRHRAAIGITEETDAVAIVISEETGSISMAYNGRLVQGLDEARLRRFLTALLLRSKKTRSTLDRVREELDFSPEKLAESGAPVSSSEIS